MSSLYNDDRDSDIIMPTEATSSQTPRQSTFTAAVAGNSLVNTVAPALLQQPSAPFTNSISELLEHSEMPGGNRRTGYADYYRRLRAEAQVLPDYSRQYQPLLDAEIINSSYRSLENINTFFVPSYLRGSRYAHKYEEVHRERAAKIRMMENSKGHTKNNSESLGHNRNSSNVSLKSRTHHGVAHDIVENPPPPFPTNPAPLPTRLNKDDKHRDLIYLNELEVKFLASSGPHRNDSEKGLEAFAIRADHPAPRQAGLYYYEVIIMTSNLHKYIFPPLSSSKVMENLLLTDKRSPMAIGFAGEKVALNRPPGWEPDSYAYHGDDGNAYASNTRGEKYRGTYGAQGEVIGCGINFSTMKIFYTKNGNLLGDAFSEVKDIDLYPMISLKKAHEHVRLNFGQTPFVYDIDQHVRKEKTKVRAQISETSISKLAGSLNESEFIQSLVVQYLTHEGYLETATAFVEEVNTKSEAAVTNTTEKDKKMKAPDPGNAHLRIGIRKAIMEGNTEDALELVRQNYPSPWFSGPSGGITFTNPNSKYDNSRMSYFMLRLQCFYEMVREHMRVRHLPTKQIGNGKAPDANGSEEWFDEVMKDVDSLNNGAGAEDTGSLMDMDASITSLKSNGTNGKVRATVSDTISMNDVDGDSDTPDNSYVTVESRFNESITEEDRKMQLAALDAKMLDYAKELKKDFGGNGDQIDVMLTSAYALFAYPEPEKVEHLSEMLSDKQRESVAESVNAAILIYHNKSPTAALERLIQQTTVLLDGLNEKPEVKSLAPFVSLQEYMRPEDPPRRFF